jgi:hypothetical protein
MRSAVAVACPETRGRQPPCPGIRRRMLTAVAKRKGTVTPLCPARSASGSEPRERAHTRVAVVGSARGGRSARLVPLARPVDAEGRLEGAALGATEPLSAELNRLSASAFPPPICFANLSFANPTNTDCVLFLEPRPVEWLLGGGLRTRRGTPDRQTTTPRQTSRQQRFGSSGLGSDRDSSTEQHREGTPRGSGATIA